MTGARTRTAARLTYRPTTSADIAVLVDHRHRMWAAIGRGTEAEILEHNPRYRRWLRPRIRTGEVAGVLAEAPDGTAAGSGLVWFRPDQPRPRVSARTSPYILSMYTRPEWRGKGIASGIVRRLLAICRDGGYGYVILHASEKGRSVYRRLGFERTWEMRYFLDPQLRRRQARRKTSARRRKRKGLDRGR
ncbi:MAG TPA: GNAT family N-acetyltransferase [Thermoplasmata archaeon]|nr:GNAT family N-acetyltransferase [Thermoplasmata archaeon]